jgi:hypothetical protein
MVLFILFVILIILCCGYILFLKNLSLFQKIIIICGIAILVSFLSIIAYGLGLGTEYDYDHEDGGHAAIKGFYPGVANTCPDYWSFDVSNNVCMIPKNKRNVGTLYDISNNIITTNIPGYNADNGSIDFNSPAWRTSTVGNGSLICTQKVWSNKYNVFWDGVSNQMAC